MKNSNDVLHKNRKINPEVYMKTQNTMNSQTILSKKSNAGGITVSDFKLYYRNITIKTPWYWHKTNRKTMDQNKRLRHKPTHLPSMDLQQRSLKHTMEKRQPLQHMLLGKLHKHM
jgi:hypothetical protein